jgi:hypothetical protein
VTSSQDGGAAVSVGKRKNAPRKRAGAGAANAAKKEAEDANKVEEEVGEEIDPNEPTYCVCGDVSYGTMVKCENENVSRSPAVLNLWQSVLLTHIIIISVSVSGSIFHV